MNYNYHTHTFRCAHASGTEEEYIQRALSGGIRYMGFSDHAPFRYADGFEANYRVPMAQVEDYFCTLRGLREKYREKIDLKIGFEMEYYPEYFTQMLENVRQMGTEYLILGQHFLQPEHPVVEPTSAQYEDPAKVEKFVDLVIGAVETGAFTYVAHPDILNFTGPEEAYAAQVRRLCEASKRLQIPLEVNFLGIRESRKYPRDDFWQIAGEVGSPVTFGFDAHDVPSAWDSASLEKAKEIVARFGLNYIGRPTLRAL